MGGSLCTGKREIKMILIGLDLSGKTAILNRLRFGEAGSTIPTIGYNYESFDYKNITFDIWDTGGQDKLRNLWRHYYKEADGAFYVVDSTDPDRMSEAKEELQKALGDLDLNGKFLCVLANKKDGENPMTVEQVTAALELKSIKDRNWSIFHVSALKGIGLYDALDWISKVNKKK